MATFNGTKLGIFVGGALIGAATDCSLSMSAEVIDTSTKDSDAWRSVLPGMRSATMSCSGLIDYQGADYDVPDLFGAFSGRTELTLVFQNEVVGDKKFTCTGYITSLEQSAGVEDTATYSATFELTGEVLMADITA